MKLNAKAASTFMLIALASAAQPQTEPLGRLFFTPEQRAVLERQKYNLGVQSDATPTILNGIVQSSSGKSTVWVNGVSQNVLAPPPSWRAGESIVPGNTESQNLLGTGRITIRRESSAAISSHVRNQK